MPTVALSVVVTAANPAVVVIDSFRSLARRATGEAGAVEVQARKTYVSVLTPRRTFARVQASKDRVQVALRLDGRKPGGLLERSSVHDDMPVQIAFATPKDVSAKAVAVLREAYEESL